MIEGMDELCFLLLLFWFSSFLLLLIPALRLLLLLQGLRDLEDLNLILNLLPRPLVRSFRRVLEFRARISQMPDKLRSYESGPHSALADALRRLKSAISFPCKKLT